MCLSQPLVVGLQSRATVLGESLVLNLLLYLQRQTSSPQILPWPLYVTGVTRVFAFKFKWANSWAQHFSMNVQDHISTGSLKTFLKMFQGGGGSPGFQWAVRLRQEGALRYHLALLECGSSLDLQPQIPPLS